MRCESHQGCGTLSDISLERFVTSSEVCLLHTLLSRLYRLTDRFIYQSVCNVIYLLNAAFVGLVQVESVKTYSYTIA